MRLYRTHHTIYRLQPHARLADHDSAGFLLYGAFRLTAHRFG